jgi:hypothetical protein
MVLACHRLSAKALYCVALHLHTYRPEEWGGLGEIENKQNDVNLLLSKTVKLLESINTKLDLLTQQNATLLETSHTANKPAHGTQADIMTLLKLPSSIRKTALALLESDKATAQDLASKTGRSRPVESDCANQLVRMGFATKKRENMEVYFFIDSSEAKK